MLFNSLTFIAFFIAVLGLYYACRSWRKQKVILVIASYLFYAAWNPPFVVLLWISTVVDWCVAIAISRTRRRYTRLPFLLVSLCVNLGLLGYFKYGTFLMESLRDFLLHVGIDYTPPVSNIILPVGISFYTFQTLSYTIDVYRGSIRPWKSFIDFALYVSFFPQLVAGPIVRAGEFLPQCQSPRWASRRQFGWGLHLLTTGLFMKTVLADTLLGPIADRVYSSWAEAGFYHAWIGTLAFSGQIYYDFAGYSICAIGAALCLGFALPDNFRYPYAAIGFSDFWRRWHISLSTWLRDYLYISLGGSRCSAARTNLNLMLTMLLGGLWHGAAWRFVVWGGLHGGYLVAEHLLRRIAWSSRLLSSRLFGPAMALVTYYFVCIAWVFFRAQDFQSAFHLVRAMTVFSSGSMLLSSAQGGIVIGISAIMLCQHWFLRDSSLEQTYERLPTALRIGLVTFMLLSIAFIPGEDRAFIYFQF